MRSLIIILIAVFSLSVMGSNVLSFSDEFREWKDVVQSSQPVKIYVEDIINKTTDKDLDAEKVTDAVRSMFSSRKNPEFKLVKSTDDAAVIFKGFVNYYKWSEKAPLTDIYSAGSVVMDQMTRGKKNWARMVLDYKITAARNGKQLLDYETQVTIKKPDIPKDKSYEMINERLTKVLAMDIFKRYKRTLHR